MVSIRLNTSRRKVAAMEGLWETRTHAPLVLFGMPDETTKTNRYAIEIPSEAA